MTSTTTTWDVGELRTSNLTRRRRHLIAIAALTFAFVVAGGAILAAAGALGWPASGTTASGGAEPPAATPVGGDERDDGGDERDEAGGQQPDAAPDASSEDGGEPSELPAGEWPSGRAVGEADHADGSDANAASADDPDGATEDGDATDGSGDAADGSDAATDGADGDEGDGSADDRSADDADDASESQDDAADDASEPQDGAGDGSADDGDDAASESDEPELSTRQVQEKLREYGFLIGPADGNAGQQTTAAVMAFQRVNGLAVDGIVGPNTIAALLEGSAEPTLAGGAADRIEVDLDAQLLHLVEDGARTVTLKVSSGNGESYLTDSGGTARAVTPVGHFTIQRRIHGVREAPLGTLYDPLYFHRGFAIHGSPSVPAYPASHGCIRIPKADAAWLIERVPNGMPVHVYGGAHVFTP